MDEDEILIELDRRFERQTESVRQLLLTEGRPDLCADLDRRLRDIRLGVDGARATWSALSRPQRAAMEFLAAGAVLTREAAPRDGFNMLGHPNGFVINVRAATVRNLMARELVGWESNRKIVLTERGRFVLRHGQGERWPK